MPEPVPIEALAAALGIGSRALVALVGGADKTTVQRDLAPQLGPATRLASTIAPDPMAPEVIDSWYHDRVADQILVRCGADGGQPFTAPTGPEPRIPELSTIVVACIGALALGKVIADRCHQPMRVAAAAGCSPYVRLTPARAARAVVSERGLRKGVPAGARFVALVTGVELPEQAVGTFVDELRDHQVEAVVLAR